MAFALGLAGCSGPGLGLAASYNRDARIDVPFEPAGDPTPVAGASAATISVATTDARATSRDRVGVIRDIFGIGMGVIVASNDIPQTVGTAVEQELAAQGFRIGPGHAIIAVQVVKFYDDFPVNGFGWSVTASVILKVTVLNTANGIVFTKIYQGDARDAKSNNFSITSGARTALIGAFQNAVNSLVTDASLHAAIFTAQR